MLSSYFPPVLAYLESEKICCLKVELSEVEENLLIPFKFSYNLEFGTLHLGRTVIVIICTLQTYCSY